MKLSTFGEKFATESGIVGLMDDLSSALNENPDMLFLGGGNPAKIPTLTERFQQRMFEISNDPQTLHSMLGIYQSTRGEKGFREAVSSLLAKEFGWKLSEKNIAISNGSQAAFFILFNMLGGHTKAGGHQSIHLPMAPEYIGYGDVGLQENLFTATKPDIEHLGDHLFKYRVDFSKLDLSNAGAICVSRPTNPTGNVLTDNEILHLDELAKAQGIPFILDGAYGLPFPGIMFNEVTPHWNENTILVLSLSKLGLPGVRTGIIIANEDVIHAYSNASTIANLASGNLGPSLSKAWFESGEILAMSQQHVRPFYRRQAELAVDLFKQALGELPYHIHKPEGAIFLWLWFEGLPISSQTLYERLKARGVLIIPGQNFFPGIEPDWQHTQECIRVSYAQEESVVREGIRIIADEVAKAYEQQ
ncbi:MAG: valine--pyruvate transaminase [Proteobacteria bacterium]|nr:MAG: valine--pyruvate transaminase [Pseudomonadota bacterium]